MLFASFMLACVMHSYGQVSTINTFTMGTGYNGSNNSGANSFITFAVQNNSGQDLRITEVGNWCQTIHNGTQSTLWYSSTSLGGTVTLATPVWTQVASQSVSGVTVSGVHPVLSGLNFIVPSGATYRIAIATNASQNNYTSGTPTQNNFTVAGMTLYTGNHQFGTNGNVGYASSNNPRFFTGYINFEPSVVVPDNAGISDITFPAGSFCAGNYPVKIKVKNSGTSTLNNVRVQWRLDGVLQANVNVTGPILKGAEKEVQLAANVLFGVNPRTIKAWTTLPNGVADTVNGDDTLDISVRAALNGVYTVGAGGDFADVVAAANALNQSGVCGPVTMNILTGTYSGAVMLDNVQGVSSVNTITFKSNTGNPADVIINAAPTGTGYVFRLSGTSYLTLKDVTLTSNALNAGRVIEFTGASSFDSVINCTINSTPFATSSNAAAIYADGLTGKSNVVLNNRISGGYYGIYWAGTGTTALTQDHIFSGNTINNSYLYATYFYYTDNLKFRNNKINTLNTVATHYGIFAYYSDNALDISNNEVVITGSGAAYGISTRYCDATANALGVVSNNSVAIDNGAGIAYGIYSYYCSQQNFINNSVNVNSSAATSAAGTFYYSSSTYSNNNIVNNVFSNKTGDGYAMYVYAVDYNNYWNYNNIYSGQPKLVETGTPAATFADLKSWRAVSKMDEQSISYNPGFTSVTDLHPDKNNPASWSLNGRALHIVGNTSDKDSKQRVDSRFTGVPDIGAYEFTPDVLPPLATATPQTAEYGTTQVFSFGEQNVASISWTPNTVLSQLEVRQYSGEKAPGIIAAASPMGSMYFYTDVKSLGSASAFSVDVKVDYMDIWLGDITNEADLRLAHKKNTSPWMVYNGNLSSVSATSNLLSSSAVNYMGTFTGLENGNIISAFVKPLSKVVMCNGAGLQLNAEPWNADFYEWFYNGVAIPGASGSNAVSYMAKAPGDYSVKVTQAGKTIESVPLTISTIAAPNAVVTASGPWVYCTGNGLVLSAGVANDLKFQWQLNGQDIPGANSNTYAVSAAGTYNVLVENIACAAISVPYVVAAGPISVDLGNDTTLCDQPNVKVQLNAGHPGAKYTWSNGAATQTIQAVQSGKYWVRVDGGANCIGTDTIEVVIDKLPSAVGISYVQNGDSYQFYASGLSNTYGYMWIFADGSVTTVERPVRSIKGNPYVRLVVFNACGSDTSQIGWPAGVDDISQNNNGLNLYPNPAKGIVWISVKNSKIETVEIYNNIGALVLSEVLNSTEPYMIQLKDIAAGLYMIKAKVGDKTLISRLDILE